MTFGILGTNFICARFMTHSLLFSNSEDGRV